MNTVSASSNNTFASSQDKIVALENLLNNVSDGVVVANSKGEFLLWNEAGKKILGQGPIQADPGDWSTTFGCFEADGVTPCPSADLPLALAIAGNAVYEKVLCIKTTHLPAPVWIVLTAEPITFDDGTTGGFAVFRDVTESYKTKEIITDIVAQLKALIGQQKSLIGKLSS